MAPLGSVIRQREEFVLVDDLQTYKRCRVQLRGQGVTLRDTVLGAELKTKEQQVCRAGDLLVAEIDAKLGGFGIVPDELDGAIVSSHYFLFAIDDWALDMDYLRYYLRTRRFQDQVIAQGTTNYAAIRPEHVLGYMIPLPPLAEQRRIVAVLDQIAPKVAEARQLASALRAPTLSPVSAHLDRLFGDPYANRRGAVAATEWVPLEQLVTDVADGPHQTPLYTDAGVPFVTALNVAPGVLTMEPVKYVSLEQHQLFQRRARAERGDVLITKDGTIGLCCLVDTDQEFSFFVSVALVKPHSELLDGQFLVWLLRSPYMQRRIRNRARGDMIKHLVLREIRALLCPVIPTSRQHEVVAQIQRVEAIDVETRQRRGEVAAALDLVVPSALDQLIKVA